MTVRQFVECNQQGYLRSFASSLWISPSVEFALYSAAHSGSNTHDQRPARSVKHLAAASGSSSSLRSPLPFPNVEGPLPLGHGEHPSIAPTSNPHGRPVRQRGELSRFCYRQHALPRVSQNSDALYVGGSAKRKCNRKTNAHVTIAAKAARTRSSRCILFLPLTSRNSSFTRCTRYQLV